MKTKFFSKSIVDGILRTMLLYFLIEFCSSSLSKGSYTALFSSAVFV